MKLQAMEDIRQRVIRKFMALPEDKQQKLSDSMGELMAKMKTEWEARPENAGKTVTYTELWDEHAKKMKTGGQDDRDKRVQCNTPNEGEQSK